VRHSRKAITSILISFDEALGPASARTGRFYGLAAGVKRVQTITFDGSTKREKIARVSHNRAAHAVRLKLAAPQKGPVRVTVRAGIVAADGMSSSSHLTAIVTLADKPPGSSEPDPARRDAALLVRPIRWPHGCFR
jgi:hypothetical protein